MNDSTPYLDAAIRMCECTEALLRDAGKSALVTQLQSVRTSLLTGAWESAFEQYRILPRWDIADLWDSMDWMESAEDRLAVEDKAKLTAYYSQTLKALGDLRVFREYGADRAVIDTSDESLLDITKQLLTEYYAKRSAI